MIYFQTHNHVDYDNELTQIEEKNEQIQNEPCIVCLEQTDNKMNKLYFKNSTETDFLKKTCQCECYIHKKCLNLWINKDSSCPICREEIVLIEEGNVYIYPITLIYYYDNTSFNRCVFFIKRFIYTCFLVCKLIAFLLIIKFLFYTILNSFV